MADGMKICRRLPPPSQHDIGHLHIAYLHVSTSPHALLMRMFVCKQAATLALGVVCAEDWEDNRIIFCHHGHSDSSHTTAPPDDTTKHFTTR